MSSVDRLARRQALADKGLKSTQIHPRLPYSSIDGGALVLKSPTGDTTGIIGEQWDGTSTTAAVGGSTPVAPSVPLVTEKSGGLALYWDGTYVDDSPTRMDFQRVTFHAVTDVELLDVLDPAQIVGEITIATGGEVFASLPPVEHFVFATTWSHAGKFSVESDVAFGTPLSIVDPAAFDDVQAEIVDLGAAVADAPAVYREGAQPTVTSGKKAIWYDTANGNVPWFFDGTTWSILEVGPGAIAADAVVASTIAVGALDGKTITGPLVQTDAAADAGIKLVGDSLVAYDGAGDPSFLIDGTDGSISMVGPVLAGGSITGTTIQTDPTANRGLKIIGNVLTAYDGSGAARFVANGSTGDVSIVGKLRTATGTTKRLEIGTSADFSKVEFYSGNAIESVPGSISAGGSGTLFLSSGSRSDVTGATSAWLNMDAQTPTGRATLTLSGQVVSIGGADGGNLYLGTSGGGLATSSTGAHLRASGNALRPDLVLEARADGKIRIGAPLAEIVNITTAATGRGLAVENGDLSVTTGKLVDNAPYSMKRREVHATISSGTWQNLYGYTIDNGGTSGIIHDTYGWTIQRAGRYEVSVFVSISSASTAGVRGIRLTKNGSSVGDVLFNGVAFQTSMLSTRTYRFSANDAIGISVYQNSGIDLSALSGEFFDGVTLRWIGV